MYPILTKKNLKLSVNALILQISVLIVWDPAAYHNVGRGIMFCPLFFQKVVLEQILSDNPAAPVRQLGTLSLSLHTNIY